MRKKPNLVPHGRCAATLITDPKALRGHWLEHFPGHQALHLELGCGKNPSRRTPQRKARTSSSPRLKKFRMPWSSAWACDRA